jgi:stearoyl-CoA desaturase (delta-9 desaturase)
MSESSARTSTSLIGKIVPIFDTHAADPAVGLTPEQANRIDVMRILPFIAIHLGCLAVIWVGFSWFGLALAVGLYIIRMVGITAFYHRYFSHRSFKSGRVVQFAMAVVGNSAVQRGPLWWAAHHRHHHRHSDEEVDAHSPMQHGFFWSHCGWFLSRANFKTHLDRVKDLSKFPELVFLDRFDWMVPVLLLSACLLAGWMAPASWGTSPLQALIWGFCISTVATAHCTFFINSLAHVWGNRDYATTDTSRNNFILAILTMGEGWHNNHHHYQSSARQGFRWWQVDVSYYVLWTMARLGLVSDLRPVPEAVLNEARRGAPMRLPVSEPAPAL